MSLQLQLADFPLTHPGSQTKVNSDLFGQRFSFHTAKNLFSPSTRDKSLKGQPTAAWNENQDSTWYSFEMPDEVLPKGDFRLRAEADRVAENSPEFSEAESESEANVDNTPDAELAEGEAIEASGELEVADAALADDDTSDAEFVEAELDVAPADDNTPDADELDDEGLEDDLEDDLEDELDDEFEEDEESDEEFDDELDEEQVDAEDCVEQLEVDELNVASEESEAAEASNDSELDVTSEENDWRAEPADDSEWTELRDKARDVAAVDKALPDVAPQQSFSLQL